MKESAAANKELYILLPDIRNPQGGSAKKVARSSFSMEWLT